MAVSITLDEGLAALHVRDKGPGMPAEARDRAFERFWRPPGRAARGSGSASPIVGQWPGLWGRCAWTSGPDDVGLEVVVRFPLAASSHRMTKTLNLPLT